jgi:antitoxin VapB
MFTLAARPMPCDWLGYDTSGTPAANRAESGSLSALELCGLKRRLWAMKGDAIHANACSAVYTQCIYSAEIPMKTAKIFKHGNSQAVRLPKEFRFEGSEVLIKRSGNGVLLIPTRQTYEQIMAVLNQFKGTIERQQPKDQKRRWQ